MVSLLFYGTERSETDHHELEVILNTHNEIFISIESEGAPGEHICLDKLTAIRLHKELKKQISYIDG